MKTPKVKVTTEDPNNFAKTLIIEKALQKWVDQNPDMIREMQELAEDVSFFNAKWGTKLKIDHE